MNALHDTAAPDSRTAATLLTPESMTRLRVTPAPGSCSPMTITSSSPVKPEWPTTAELARPYSVITR